MKILESAQNYLETILILQKRNGFVRAIDIANELNFTKASVSIAMKQLRESGYTTIDGDNNISLLPTGLEIAEAMYERHVALTKMLMLMGVSDKTASEDACKIEHVISEETLEAVKNYISKQ